MNLRADDLIAPDVLADAQRHAAAFARREPFRHLVIDGFFSDIYARHLLEQFPDFARGNARNEAGELGAKSTVERIRDLGPAYLALDDLIQTRPFLDWVGRVTGIGDLLYDPWYFGGGTHENRTGQDLDPHIDFNRHPVEPWHRRLNLIVYLNPLWDDAWGGSLELHSDPRSDEDRVTTITPAFNRCVIFETTEWSWHGFPRIEIPAEHGDLSRRSIALYFYTRDRPAEELAGTHSTIYVDRPLPAHIRAGRTLDEADLQTLRVLLKRRDQHNQRLYRDLASLTEQLEQAKAAIENGRMSRWSYLARRILARLKS
ncbi:MAG TPA: 2OG-Fe(II) oxygenase [Dokdonella sp.]|uniref:2OG-Fe(II) oxygenase n=1 Tax=Dokdonella sp. TaxID=2291710 RepID=UPI002CFCE299|nr:2OG-Fe(II) oxygenase [Dokdonella sp.]HUD41638.1 2OG-Fe(II) oxygenase [Dokdonella sp.]